MNYEKKYKEWSGDSYLTNSCNPIHDSSEMVDFVQFVDGHKLTDITHRNYEATKRRGLITDKTTKYDFYDKLVEEVIEYGESDLKDEKELADIALVCFAMAEHYGIDLIEEMRKKTEFNEKRV